MLAPRFRSPGSCGRRRLTLGFPRGRLRVGPTPLSTSFRVPHPSFPHTHQSTAPAGTTGNVVRRELGLRPTRTASLTSRHAPRGGGAMDREARPNGRRGGSNSAPWRFAASPHRVSEASMARPASVSQASERRGASRCALVWGR